MSQIYGVVIILLILFFVVLGIQARVVHKGGCLNKKSLASLGNMLPTRLHWGYFSSWACCFRSGPRYVGDC